MQVDNEGNGCSEMASDMRRRNMDSDKGNSILMNSSVSQNFKFPVMLYEKYLHNYTKISEVF